MGGFKKAPQRPPKPGGREQRNRRVLRSMVAEILYIDALPKIKTRVETQTPRNENFTLIKETKIPLSKIPY